MPRKRTVPKRHSVRVALTVPELSKRIRWTRFAEMMDELAYGR